MIPAASCSCQQIRSYAQNCSPPPFVAFSASFSFNRVVFYPTYLQKGILSRAWIAFSIPAPCLQKPIVITQITYLTAAYLSVLNGPSIDYNHIFFRHDGVTWISASFPFSQLHSTHVRLSGYSLNETSQSKGTAGRTNMWFPSVCINMV